MNGYTIAKTLAALVKEGGTVNSIGEVANHKLGYYVGGVHPALVFNSQSEVDRGEIGWWVGRYPADHYGVWTDEETGKVWFDATSWHVIKSSALIVARQRGELAIWDIKNEQEIRVSQPEGE